MPEWAFLASVLAWAVLIFTLLVWSVRTGHRKLAVVACWLASPVPIAIVAKAMEQRYLLDILAHFQYASWALLLGDTIFLPFSAWMMARAWATLPLGGWKTSWWWLVVSAGAGAAFAGIVRHIEAVRYAWFYAFGSLSAPSMLVHDFCAFPVLFGAMFCLGVPLFVRTIKPRKPFVQLYVAPHAVWAVLGVAALVAVWLGHDGNLSPQFLSPNYWLWP